MESQQPYLQEAGRGPGVANVGGWWRALANAEIEQFLEENRGK